MAAIVLVVVLNLLVFDIDSYNVMLFVSNADICIGLSGQIIYQQDRIHYLVDRANNSTQI